MSYGIVSNMIGSYRTYNYEPIHKSKTKKIMTIEKICETIENYFYLEKSTLQKVTRKQEVVYARQFAHYFAFKMLELSYPKIGRSIGNKKHATVIYSIKIINNLLEYDKQTKKHVDELWKRLSQKS